VQLAVAATDRISVLSEVEEEQRGYWPNQIYVRYLHEPLCGGSDVEYCARVGVQFDRPPLAVEDCQASKLIVYEC